VLLARQGLPVVVLVTEEFEEEARFVARAAGMPGIPMVFLPHPVAGTSWQSREELAERIAPRCLALLRGEAQADGGGP
jgi:hypothetical protein